MGMGEVDIDQVRETFEQANFVLQGKSFAVSVAALQDLLSAAICYAAPTMDEALSLTEDLCKDILATVAKNYEHYHSQRATDVAPT
jgi:hypothetical protein